MPGFLTPNDTVKCQACEISSVASECLTTRPRALVRVDGRCGKQRELIEQGNSGANEELESSRTYVHIYVEQGVVVPNVGSDNNICM